MMNLSDGLPLWPCGLRYCQRLLGISQIVARACKKLVSDLRLDSGFCWVIRFPHLLQLAKHDFAVISQKRYNRNSKFICQLV